MYADIPLEWSYIGSDEEKKHSSDSGRRKIKTFEQYRKHQILHLLPGYICPIDIVGARLLLSTYVPAILFMGTEYFMYTF